MKGGLAPLLPVPLEIDTRRRDNSPSSLFAFEIDIRRGDNPFSTSVHLDFCTRKTGDPLPCPSPAVSKRRGVLTSAASRFEARSSPFSSPAIYFEFKRPGIPPLSRHLPLAVSKSRDVSPLFVLNEVLRMVLVGHVKDKIAIPLILTVLQWHPSEGGH